MVYRNYIKTLDRHLNSSYEDFDLSDDTFDRYIFWHDNIPKEIKDIWTVLQTDERFLIVLVAHYNYWTAHEGGCL